MQGTGQVDFCILCLRESWGGKSALIRSHLCWNCTIRSACWGHNLLRGASPWGLSANPTVRFPGGARLIRSRRRTPSLLSLRAVAETGNDATGTEGRLGVDAGSSVCEDMAVGEVREHVRVAQARRPNAVVLGAMQTYTLRVKPSLSAVSGRRCVGTWKSRRRLTLTRSGSVYMSGW